MKDNMNGKVSWNVFAYRFEDREQVTFEELCYQLFCRKFDLKEGLHRFYNQHYIETDPARISESRVVGFQTKYFESKVINDNQKKLLKETIEKAAVKYPEMTELFFYITSEFSESSKPDQTKTDGQIAIEECAREHGIKLEWVMPSNLEVILQGKEYRSIWNYYFNPDQAKAGRSPLSAEEESIVRYAQFITEKYTELNSNIVNGSAVGIMDQQTITLYAPEQWTERFFGQEVNAQKHAIVLCSREGESYWLHTRGMAEFGRPDIGISGVPEGKVDAYKLIIDQMIYYGGLGAFFDSDTRVHTADGKAYVIHTEFVNDFENEDYNNAYYVVEVVEEE